MRLVQVYDERPYCSRHYHKLAGSLCANCQKGIEGSCVSLPGDSQRSGKRCKSSKAGEPALTIVQTIRLASRAQTQLARLYFQNITTSSMDCLTANCMLRKRKFQSSQPMVSLLSPNKRGIVAHQNELRSGEQ